MLRTLFIALVLLCSFSAARADNIFVTSGSASVSGNGFYRFTFFVQGNNFTFSGVTDTVVGSFGPSCLPCAPGAALTPNAGTLAQTFFADWSLGTINYNGTIYDLREINSRANFMFSGGAVILPPLSSATSFSLTTPFGMFFQSGSWGHSFNGGGIASLNFSREGDLYRLNNVSYQFTNVPEPASVLLLCSGVVGLAVKLRSRRG